MGTTSNPTPFATTLTETSGTKNFKKNVFSLRITELTSSTVVSPGSIV